ncbi:MAG: polyprenol monophosphomannose synthase [Candidatus Omnitrophota bacterium]
MPEKSISLIIPTFNEVENIRETLSRSINVLDGSGCSYEILVIDDFSPDGTAAAAETILGNKGRVVIRKGKSSGLSASIIDGLSESQGEYLIIMDADGSHPPELIREFVAAISLGYELIVASRYIKDGGTCRLPLRLRIISLLGCLFGSALTKIRDNTSGFFCIKKSALNGVILAPYGFKIGLEILVKAKYRNFKEIPYIFSARNKGKSKLSAKIILQYFQQYISLLFRVRKSA